MFSPRHVLVLLLVYAIVGYPFAVIFRRAGYTGWLSLLMFVPLANVTLVWWFAYAKWSATPSA